MPGPKYISDFEFPSDKGFSGSAGVQHVKGYARGGKVTKTASPAPMGALAAKGPKGIKPVAKPKGGPNMAARATTPGGFKKGGSVDKNAADCAPGKAMTKSKRGGFPGYKSAPLIGD